MTVLSSMNANADDKITPKGQVEPTLASGSS